MIPIADYLAPTSLLNLLPLVITSGCVFSHKPEENRSLIEELEKSLRDELLNPWYPASLDTIHGGFLTDFSHDWQLDGPQNKMIVTQSRHVWTTSQSARFFNEERFRSIAEHGFHFLKDQMWDKTYGGFYWLRSREGGSIPGATGDAKSAYGNAFAIYALASYFAMSGDPSALELAQQTFYWLDKHSRDQQYKGYVDQLSRDGAWSSRSNSPALATAGWKDQNSSIHLLEAFTDLYRVWPDRLLRERIVEMLVLIRDTITHERGYLTLFFERDWTPISFRDSSAAVQEANYTLDHVSFGHDVETAYLMLEASHALGKASDPKTLTVAKRMVDHALANGWDNDIGGFYYEGYYLPSSDSITILNQAKEWWVQAEGLNALLLMAELFPQEKKYADAFLKQWEYMNIYLIDHEHGGWYKDGLDKNPEQLKGAKGSEWKVNYHEARSLMNCIKMLKSEHELIKK